MSEFETLFRREAAGFAVRRHAGLLLREALEAEQAGGNSGSSARFFSPS